MSFDHFHSLLSLSTEKIVWSIRVRAQAVWKGINRTTNEFRGLNIIFIDDQDCRIHAFISDKISDGYVEDLIEGQIYSVSNFKVHHYDGEEKYRAVRNEKHIYFDKDTKMSLLTEDIGKIQPYAFDLYALQDVDRFVTDTRFLIDVIGILATPNPICVVSKDDNEKCHLKFKITDGRNELNVTFFNDFGQSFEKTLKEIEEQPVVIIIASAKVNKYEATGETYLTNYPATRFYLNPTHYSVRMLQISLPVSECEEESDERIYTVQQIKQFGKEYLEKNVLCSVTVNKVDEECNWYDNFCTKCGHEVNKVDGRFRCTECKRNLPYPDKRFRVCTICSDSSGSLPIILPDEEIQRIVGKDVYDLENENREAGEDNRFPPVLLQLKNKQYIITLIVAEENIFKSSNVYHATKIGNPEEMLETHNPSRQISPEMEDLSMNTDTSSIKPHMTNSSPPTGRSSNRIRGRKTKATVKCEFDEETRLSKVKKS